MKNSVKILFLIIFYCTISDFYGQNCELTYKLVSKNKKKVTSSIKKFSKNWLKTNSDSLNLPNNISLGKILFNPEEDDRWDKIDSLLCGHETKSYKIKAEETMIDKNMLVYQRKGYSNSLDKSLIMFEFNYIGKIILIIIRENSENTGSTIYYNK